MSDIKTLSHMIIDLYKTAKNGENEPLPGVYAYSERERIKEIDSNRLIETLEKIDKYNKLDELNINNLYLATLISYKYSNFYEILEYFCIPEVLSKENRIKYYIIKYNMFYFFSDKDSVTFKDMFYGYDVDKYLHDVIDIQEYKDKFEDSIPTNMKAKYSIEVDNMVDLLLIIYSCNYDNNYEKLNSLLLEFINEYMEEMDLHGIKSWYHYRTNREEYIMFLEHYLNNGLNDKKVIK